MPKKRKSDDAKGPEPDDLYTLSPEDDQLIRYAFGHLSAKRKTELEAKLKTSKPLQAAQGMIGLFLKEYPTTSINIFRVRVILAVTDLNWASARQERQRKALRAVNPEYMKGRRLVLDTVVV